MDSALEKQIERVECASCGEKVDKGRYIIFLDGGPLGDSLPWVCYQCEANWRDGMEVQWIQR